MEQNKTTLKVLDSSEDATVVFEYKKPKKKITSFQSEEQLEVSFINQLVQNGFEYAKNIKKMDQLIENLKVQIEKLNEVKFSENDWKNLFNKYLNNDKEDSKDKTKKIQTDDYLFNFEFEDGTTKNIKIIDKDNIYKNSLQVINQFVNDESDKKNIYDVFILVNGLPLVSIELKKRSVDLREAFNQINRYKQESFSVGSKIFNWIQIFVISNGTQTKYFSNTIRNQIINNKTKLSNITNILSIIKRMKLKKR